MRHKKFIFSKVWKEDKTTWMREYMRDYRDRYPEKYAKVIRKNTEYKKNNLVYKEKQKVTNKRYKLTTRVEILTHYSKGTPVCACCGETIIEFLCIDHIHGGGNKHRKENKISQLSIWLARNNFPKGFQVLCHNCNYGKYRCGVCPHLSKSKV